MKRNTVRTTGIISCSLFIVLFLSFFSTWAEEPERSAGRHYEIQFFTVKVHKKLDYARLQKIGIEKILFRVFQDDVNDGGLYFFNTQFKMLKPALEELIEEFDFSKLDLCAWMIGRNFKWTEHSRLLDYHVDGGKREPVRKLDLFNPEAVKRVVTVFKELASHKIDAILIQDDLMIRYNEGFSNWGKAYFRKTAGVPPKVKLMMQKNTPYYQNWNRVKIDRLNDVLRQIVTAARSVNSAIKIGINVYYESPVFIDKAEAWYSHNLSEMVKTGVDYIYLMSYQRQIKDEMKLSEARNRELFKKIVESAYEICKDKLVVKIQLRDWNTAERVPVDEVRAYLALVPEQVRRICFTPVTMKDYDYLEEILREPRKTRSTSMENETGNKSVIERN